MSTLTNILMDISRAGQTLAEYVECEANYNTIYAGELEKLSDELYKIAQEISEIQGYFR